MFLALEAAWTRCELDAGSSAFHPPLARRPSKTFPLRLMTWAFVSGAPTVADLEGTLQPVDTRGGLKSLLVGWPAVAGPSMLLCGVHHITRPAWSTGSPRSRQKGATHGWDAPRMRQTRHPSKPLSYNRCFQRRWSQNQ
jgi:hypothetical protein